MTTLDELRKLANRTRPASWLDLLVMQRALPKLLDVVEEAESMLAWTRSVERDFAVPEEVVELLACVRRLWTKLDALKEDSP